MSLPSTPRGSRLASPGRDADGPEPSQEIMTPGRRVKALLAAFDDSDSSGSENERPRASSSLLRAGKTAWPWEKKQAENDTENRDEEEEEDDAVFVPRGRLAARMQAEDDASADESNLDYPKETSRAESDSSSEEQGPIAKLKRRLLNRGTKATRANTESASRSPRRERSESPLFVQSYEEIESQQNDDDDNGGDEEQSVIPAGKNERLMALIAAKRKEREERERLEAEKNAARMERMQQFNSDLLSDEESDEENTTTVSRNLTQEKARKPRKASKKALEEMARETQRMSRNMQLAYQEITKKKITKESFLARFNFGQPKESPNNEEPSAANSSSAASSPPSTSAGEEKKDVTPPTSPDRPLSEQRDKSPTLDFEGIDEVADPEPAQPAPSAADKGKARMTQAPMANVRVRVSREEVARHQKEAPDDELEIITSPAKCRRIAAFENLPARHAQEPEPILKLKHLAHLTSPTRRSKSVTPAELSAALRAQARQQAAKERQEKIEELRARGIVIETAEERAAMEDEVEDMLEKARREAAELSRRERAEQEAGAGADDDDDDADYELSGSEEEEEAGPSDEDEEVDEEELEDEEEDEEQDEVMVEDDNEDKEKVIDEEASETERSDDEKSEAMSADGHADAIATAGPRRRPLRVLSDDEEDQPKSPQVLRTPARSITTPFDSAKKPQFPDMPGPKTATMSLSQAFAGTLGDNPPDAGDDALDNLEEPPDPAPFIPDVGRAESEILVKDSQEDRRESIDFGNYTQSITRVSESPMARGWSQPSQIPEPTQDAGFVLSQFDQSKRFVGTQASTVDTVLLSQRESPVQKKGRLLRRGRRAESNDTDEERNGFEVKASAFDVMRKVSKKAAIAFDKDKSLAKEHVEEAAEESDDEYAGLGGASDDSSGEEDEEDRAMINDDSNEVVDEKELAALNADHQRAMDEKEISRLYRDITTGALRRRRGADDLDLDDSEDERMARRRAKQREFARMRKALLADDKIGQIAANPKTQAFFRAIEDLDEDDDVDLEFLGPGADSQEPESQDAQAEPQQPGTEEAASPKRKRPLEALTDNAAHRPPAKLRRTAAPSAMTKKPATLAEIRESVSFLIETPEYDKFEDASAVEDDEDEEDSTTHRSTSDGFAIPRNPRRTNTRIVDRLALLRAASSNSASSNNSRTAFMSASSDSTSQLGFRPPALIRRSTTASSSSTSVTSGNDSIVTAAPRTTTGPATSTSGIKKGAVNYYTAARERERERELRMKQRDGKSNLTAMASMQQRNAGLSTIMGSGTWE